MSRKSELLTNSIKDNYIKSLVIFLEEDCDAAITLNNIKMYETTIMKTV